MKGKRLLEAFGTDKQIYTVNGVKYIVSSRFQPLNLKTENTTMSERIEKYLQNDMADLIHVSDCDTMSHECVPTAGKED